MILCLIPTEPLLFNLKSFVVQKGLLSFRSKSKNQLFACLDLPLNFLQLKRGL